jgi:raffinose/stachyose/melibiose transport system substrate-binding protein
MSDRTRNRIGFLLFAAGYLCAVYWVFTRSAPLDSGRPVILRFAHWQIEAGPPDGIAAVIKRYEELNPRVRVEQQLVPGAVYKQWLRSNLAGGTGADLIEWGPWLEGVRDVPARHFVPVTEELKRPNPYNRGTPLERERWEQTFIDGLSGQRIDSPDPGQVYGITLTEVSLRFFCNRELLRDITGTDAVPQTFAELRRIFDLLPEYSRRVGRPVMGLAGARDNTHWLLDFLLAGTTMGLNFQMDDYGYLALYNRQLLAGYLHGRWNFRQPEVRAGFELLREVAQHMKPGFMQVTRDEATREFLGGDALFIFAGTWDATSLRRLAPFTVGALRFPQPTLDDPVVGRYLIGRSNDGGGITAMAMHLSKHSRHPAEALDFLHFLTSVEGMQLFTNASGWLPSVREVKIPAEIESFKGRQDGFASANPYTLIGSNVSMLFARNIHLLLGERGSVEQFTEELDRIMPEAVRSDLQTELRSSLTTLKDQEMRMVAHANLAADERSRREWLVLEAGQTLSEGFALEMARNLATTAPQP